MSGSSCSHEWGGRSESSHGGSRDEPGCALGEFGYSESLGVRCPKRSDPMYWSSIDELIVLGRVAKDVQSGRRMSADEELGCRDGSADVAGGCRSRSSFS